MGSSTEPLSLLQSALLNLSGLSDYVGTRVGQDFGMSYDGMPCVIWTPIGEAMARVDAESWKQLDLRLQISLFGSDLSELLEIKGIIDGLAGQGLNELHLTGELDGYFWKCSVMRRVDVWKKIVWQSRQRTDGNNVIQLTSDWRYRTSRRQARALFALSNGDGFSLSNGDRLVLGE